MHRLQVHHLRALLLYTPLYLGLTPRSYNNLPRPSKRYHEW
nr:MAG TPA: hypothetical protein [Bacteriophage sp.]